MDGGRLEVGEATEAEMDLFRWSVRDGEPKAVLSDWHLIALRRVDAGTFQLAAVGVSSATGRWWLTLPVLALEGHRRLHTASGSLYGLGVRRMCGEDAELPDRVRRGLCGWGHVG